MNRGALVAAHYPRVGHNRRGEPVGWVLAPTSPTTHLTPQKPQENGQSTQKTLLRRQKTARIRCGKGGCEHPPDAILGRMSDYRRNYVPGGTFFFTVVA